MFATYVIKIEQSMLCMTGVYFKDITNIIFIILHLNVSHLSAPLVSMCIAVWMNHVGVVINMYASRLGFSLVTLSKDW